MATKVNLAIVGGRDFQDFSKMCFVVHDYVDNPNIEVVRIVSGGAPGADTLAEACASWYFIEKVVFHADWEKYGKSAGFLRNKQIVDISDMVLAFWDGKSKGTKHTIDLAIEAKKPVLIISY
jgi:hypothetical protein